jgi:poly(3-hydroxybutyrate) depolymerase
MKILAGLLWSAACALAQPARRSVARIATAAALAAIAIGGASLAGPAGAQALKKQPISVGGGMNPGNRSYSYYVSSKANHNGYNLVVYALHDNGQTAEQFAQSSGWIKVAEDNGFVVIFPEAANKAWSPFSGEEDAYLKAVFDHASTHMTAAPGPNDPPPAPGAGGGGNEGGGAGPGGIRIGTWQPWQYFTGVGAGARVAQEFAVNNPGLVTAVATLDGTVYRATLAKGDEMAQDYLEDQRGNKTVVPIFRQMKKEVAMPAWLFTTGAPTAGETALETYWKHSDGVGAAAPKTIDGFQTAVYSNPRNAVEQVRVTTVPAGTQYNGAMASAIWGFFSHAARWTSVPNGAIDAMMTEPEVDRMFTIRQAKVGDLTYKYYVKTPSSYAKGKSMPLVISLHGFGFPAWMYLSQIKLHEVGEKEGFITAYLNGQQNHWDFTKPEGNDSRAIAQVIDDMAAAYGIDRSRVYLQGFSFGSGMTFTEGVTHPQLFAAVSPNAGIGDFSNLAPWIADLKAKRDIRLPMMVVYGAVDSASSNDGLIPAKGTLRDAIDMMKAYDGITTPDSTRPFDSPAGPTYDVLVPGAKLTQVGPTGRYPKGRFAKYDYLTDDKKQPMFSWVWVVDMPHGTARGQAELVWDFFKNWRRNPDGSLTYLGH